MRLTGYLIFLSSFSIAGCDSEKSTSLYSGVGNPASIKVTRLTDSFGSCEVAIDLRNEGSTRITAASINMQFYSSTGESLADGIAAYSNILPNRTATESVTAVNTACASIAKVGNLNGGPTNINLSVDPTTQIPMQ